MPILRFITPCSITSLPKVRRKVLPPSSGCLNKVQVATEMAAIDYMTRLRERWTVGATEGEEGQGESEVQFGRHVQAYSCWALRVNRFLVKVGVGLCQLCQAQKRQCFEYLNPPVQGTTHKTGRLWWYERRKTATRHIYTTYVVFEP
jgi:hypothetical protein